MCVCCCMFVVVWLILVNVFIIIVLLCLFVCVWLICRLVMMLLCKGGLNLIGLCVCLVLMCFMLMCRFIVFGVSLWCCWGWV